MKDLNQIRRNYAQKIARDAALQSSRLQEAFATIPREDFVGPGPWQVMSSIDVSRGYQSTPDANPAHLYQMVTVALDATRFLNNGEPRSLARWLDELKLDKGSTFLHVGAGAGYYTAIAAQVVSPDGRVLALEADTTLADRSARNLSNRSNVEVRCASAPLASDGPFDAIFINAGVTDLDPAWIDLLSENGKLLVPITASAPDSNIGFGHMLLIEHTETQLNARFVTTVGIYHCVDARSEQGEERLRASFASGHTEDVASVRRDRHEADSECWLHSESICLSTRGRRDP